MKRFLANLLIAFSGLAQAAPEGETITYYVTDHLGTPVVAMNEQGGLLWKRQYSAFGDAQQNENGVQVGYTGHEFVPESGLSYMGSRWYHPEIGRFLQPDPVGFVPSNTLSFNRYLYVNNNPYMHEDPDGEFLDLIIEVASITIGVTSAIQNFSQGNIKEGLYDVGGVVADGVLMVVPGVPGGVGATRHALKNSDNLVDGAQTLARACSFAEGTLVTTPDGLVPIESLERGDQVLARSESGEEMDYKRILDAYSHEHYDGMTLTVSHWDETTETLTTTQEHPFYVEEIGFVPAGELEAGLQIVTADGLPVTIVSIDLTPIQLVAYNYTVEDYSTYFVGESGLWVHNSCRISVANMREFFDTGFGNSLKNISNRTNRRFHGQTVYTVTGKNDFGLKKGDQYYLDGLHKDHLEVFDSRGNFKQVMNLDGSINVEKTIKALEEGRTLE